MSFLRTQIVGEFLQTISHTELQSNVRKKQMVKFLNEFHRVYGILKRRWNAIDHGRDMLCMNVWYSSAL